MDQLLNKISKCTLCQNQLEFGVNPVVSASKRSKIVIIGQAPGRIVHETGIPWDDKSGDNLRNWLGVNKSSFYDTKQFALIPMGFCYPGKGKSGDLPPRPECAPQWHRDLFDKLEFIELILLIGQYAQQYYLGNKVKNNLTETVKTYRDYLPEYFVLPHPSPRNNIWRKKNDWFDKNILPELHKRVTKILN